MGELVTPLSRWLGAHSTRSVRLAAFPPTNEVMALAMEGLRVVARGFGRDESKAIADLSAQIEEREAVVER